MEDMHHEMAFFDLIHVRPSGWHVHGHVAYKYIYD